MVCFSGKPDAGNLHVRFDEGEGCRASGTLSTLLVNGFLSTKYANIEREKEISRVFSVPSATSVVDYSCFSRSREV